MLPPLMKGRKTYRNLRSISLLNSNTTTETNGSEFSRTSASHKWDENILELKSFIKALDVPSAEIVIQQKDRIELAKMNLMIDESKEFSLKESISGLEKNIVIRHCLSTITSISTSKALGLANHTVRI